MDNNLDKLAGRLFKAAVIAVSLIILGTLFVFIFDNRVGFSGIDPDTFGQFGDFIGGVGGTFLNLTTLIFLYLNYMEQKKVIAETKKLTLEQIDIAVKPDVIITNTPVSIYSKRNNVLPSFFANIYHDVEDPNKTYLLINFLNIGLAAAKNIKVEFDFDRDRAIEALNDHLPKAQKIITLSDGWGIKFNKKKVNVGTGDFGGSYDYLLPVSEKDSHRELYLPNADMLLYLTGELFHQKIKDFSLNAIPTIKVQYGDIRQNIYEKIFYPILEYRREDMESSNHQPTDYSLTFEGAIWWREYHEIKNNGSE